MTTAVSTQALPRCQRCAGQMYIGYEGERTCLWCGEVWYPPAPSLQHGEDLEEWRRRLRGKPGRPRRAATPDQDACA